MATRVFGIRLTPRQAWAWQRLGNDHIRQWIAPGGECVQCGCRPSKPNTRNGWFCFPCQDGLDQQSLLPEPETEVLQKQNQDLRAQINQLNEQLRDSRQLPDPPEAQQASLFQEE